MAADPLETLNDAQRAAATHGARDASGRYAAGPLRDEAQDVGLGRREPGRLGLLPVELARHGGEPREAVGEARGEGLGDAVELHGKES